MHIAVALLALSGCDRALIEFGTAPFDSGTVPETDADTDVDTDADGDGDGDGVPTADDCDDHDPDVGGPGPEAWNGRDDDCDGVVDDLAVGDIALGFAYGSVSDTHIGSEGGVALGEDLTGDGIGDLVVGSLAYSGGMVAVISGARLLGGHDDVASLSAWQVMGASGADPLGYVSPLAIGDLTGDGRAELLAVSVNPEHAKSWGAALLLPGGADLHGTYDSWHSWEWDWDWDLLGGVFYGDAAGDRLWRAIVADLDGDGVGDVVTGTPYDAHRIYEARGGSRGRMEWSDIPETGNVSVFLGSDAFVPDGYFGPIRGLSNPDDDIHGTTGSAHLGASLTAVDLDGDGKDDILASAPGAPGDVARQDRVAPPPDDDEDNATGVVYLFPGTDHASWASDDADGAGRFRILADRDVHGLGVAQLARPGDLDGDGRLDLAIADPGVAIHVWYDAARLEGTVPFSTADLVVQVGDDCGHALATDADLDADGVDELIAGCPGAASETGALRIFSGSTLISEIAGTAPDDHFGSSLSSGVELDRDEEHTGDEIAVGAPGNDDNALEAGVVYLLGRRD